MSTKRKQLLLCVLHRAGKPLTSGEAVDRAHGLATSEGWPADLLEELNRRRASKLLENMVIGNTLMFAGDVKEDGNSRTVPTYAPMGGQYDADYPIPEAPEVVRTSKRVLGLDTSRKQLLAIIEEQTNVLDAQADMLECVQRFQADIRSRMENWQRKIGQLKAEVS